MPEVIAQCPQCSKPIWSDRSSDYCGYCGVTLPDSIIGELHKLRMAKQESAKEEISSPIKAARMSQLSIYSAAGLIVCFFLPWVQVLGFGVSGYNFSQLGSYGNLAWLIPISAGITLLVGLNGRDAKLLQVITGSMPWLLLIYTLIQVGSDLFQGLAIGAYLSLLAGAALIFDTAREE